MTVSALQVKPKEACNIQFVAVQERRGERGLSSTITVRARCADAGRRSELQSNGHPVYKGGHLFATFRPCFCARGGG